MDSSPTIHAGPLGAQTQYQDGYDKSLLHPMARAEGRQAVGLDGWQLAGEDQWTAYEFSWLNARGKPEVAELSFNVPVTSPNIIESKSMKLYLNGFSQTRFANAQELLETLERISVAALAALLQRICAGLIRSKKQGCCQASA